ncbi:uncharacterized protein LOC135849645 [Planococcus citri]|uniref:uncharacterized protein LOC135849645 n=1 Tax=Planococcus citri TaxID=170843 RepID=UPI0031F9A986
MGNNHSFHILNHSHKSVLPNSSSSKTDLQPKTVSPVEHLSPMEKLGKLLAQRSLQEDSINGVACGVFKRYLFPHYTEIGKRLFSYLCTSSCGPASSHVISVSNFKTQTEKLLGIMSDHQLIQIYVTMYADGKDKMVIDQFHELVYAVYKLAMDHYPDGPQSCRYIFTTIKAVVDSAFHKKSELKTTYLANWITHNCPRLILLLHRYIVHVLSTGYRSIIEKPQVEPSELELTTPVLEKTPSFEVRQPLLPVSQVWILATTLPQLYIQPTQHHSSPCMAPTFLSKIMDLSCPSHWTLLYNSNQHGIGTNRFLHHVLGYRGPTLTFLRGSEDVEFCLAATDEWRESHLFWGGEDCMLIQILPLYKVVEKGAKLVYLNTSIRGYPLGIRVGADPRAPSLQVDQSFDKLTYCGIPYALNNMEVWGCSSPKSREIQLQIKDWEVKQAESNRKVKITSSDWLDHPDRYLLELAGRTSYATGGSSSSAS